MSEPVPQGVEASVSPWVDLVYHALSHVPVPETDASSLFDEGYVRWSERRLGEAGLRAGTVPRTLLDDAPLMARLYADSPQGFLLHAWPLLWDDVEGFLRDARTRFECLEWADADRGRLAAAIRDGVASPLPELFRTALWSEAANGYAAAWERVVAPRSRSFREELHDLLGAVAERMPVLREATWVLCHPLRVHGRLLERPGVPPIIAVGVADAELGVPAWHPVVQGCHECFVGQAREAPSAEQWATVPGRPGHEAFRAVEETALSLGARFFLGSPWEAAYLEWLGRLFAQERPGEAAARLAAAT